jgi:type VI secretion system protein ImpC
MSGIQTAKSSMESDDAVRGRVDWGYWVELNNKRSRIKLPFVIGVMADLHGTKPCDEPLTDRKFRRFYHDNFDDHIRRLAPRVAVQLPADQGSPGETVEFAPRCLADFEPLGLVQLIPSLRIIFNARWLLAECRDGLITQTHFPGATRNTFAVASNATAIPASGRWQRLIQQVGIDFETARERLKWSQDPYGDSDNSIADVPTEVLEPLIADEVLHGSQPLVGRLDTLVRRMDCWLTDQVHWVLHQAEFQRLESTYRGLKSLVSNLPDDELLYVLVLQVSKAELRNDLQGNAEVLRSKYLNEAYSGFPASPIALLVADFMFDCSSLDVRVLAMLADLAASGHSTLVTGVAPALFDCDSFDDLAGRRRLPQLFRTPVYDEWREFTKSSAAQAVVAVLPRLLGRELYLEAGTAPDRFRFEERVNSAQDLVWTNSAFAFAEKIARIYRRDEWWWSAGVIEDQVVAQVPTWDCTARNGQIVFCCPTETPLDDPTTITLASLGFTCLQHEPGTDSAVFRKCSTLHVPAPPMERINLATLMNAWQVARYIRSILLNDVPGRGLSGQEVVTFIDEWLQGYVVAEGAASEAGRPLAFADVSLILEDANYTLVSVTLREIGAGDTLTALEFQVRKPTYLGYP